jgi:hypothetical protein
MEFLESIDFFVYYHHKDRVESFGRVIMEAMFAGAVAILPPSFEACYRDWSRFQAQSQRGLAYVLENCTAAAYRRRLARLGVDISSESVQLEIAK